MRQNKRGTAKQRIKEGKQATHWTRLSCHRFHIDAYGADGAWELAAACDEEVWTRRNWTGV